MSSDARIAIVDPSAGASGDMFLGALIACGASVDWLTGLPARLGLGDEVTVEVAAVRRATIAATKVTVRVRGEAEQPGNRDHHHGPHRHVAELIKRIGAAPLSEPVRQRAVAAFRLLAEAEGRVHGKAPELVSLHEVGAWDALIDVVGTVEGFERLGVTALYHRPLPLGSGWVRGAHGAMAVPAPATAILLEGLEVAGGGPVEGEAVTPTGAALLRILSSGPPPARWRPLGQGWGAGTRDPEHYANALRIFLAAPVAEAAELEVLVADLDDLVPEYLEPLREALMDAGAVDVQVWATQMKKGRSGMRVEAQCPVGLVAAVEEAFFRHSTTAGVRRYRATRTALGRRTIEVPLEGGTVRVKVLDGPDGPRYKPEFDDVTAIARRTQLPALAVAQRAHELARAMAGVGRNEEQQ